jgi:hypothetical protein
VIRSAPSKPGDLVIDTIEVLSGAAQVDTKTKVRTQLHAGDASIGAFSVLYYDGDPRQGGTLFDVQLIPAIPAQSTYVSRVFMRPATAGAHTIFVVAAPGTGGAVTRSVPLMVLAP